MVSVMVERIVDTPPIAAAMIDPVFVTISPGARVKLFPEQQSSGDAVEVGGQQKRPSPQGRMDSNAAGFTLLQKVEHSGAVHVGSVQLLRLNRLDDGLKHNPLAKQGPAQQVVLPPPLLQGTSPYAFAPFGR